MNRKDLSLQQKRLESLYEREIRKIIYQIIKKESLSFIPISFCKADKKFQSIKIYISIENNEENEKYINSFNRKYNSHILGSLAKIKKFRRVPKIIFTFDEELNRINSIEERLKIN